MISPHRWHKALITCALMATVFTLPAASQSCLSVTPANLVLNFPQKAVDTQSLVQDVVIQNLCSASLTINSFSYAPTTGFKLFAGWSPETLAEGQLMTYEVVFAPKAVQTYTGNFTVNVNGYSPVVVTLTGKGIAAGAVDTLSATSLTFSNVAVGTTSAAQNVIVTNSGTKGATIVNIYADPPFAVTGFAINEVIKAGTSITLPVTFSPSSEGSFNGTLVITTNDLPPMGATLYATAVAPTQIAITNFPTMPVGTQSFPYLASFGSVNGVGTVNWSLAPGSTLPSGLSLSSSGTITGTIASTVAVGSYPFGVTATDSSGNNVTQQFTLPVATPTGSDCGNIDWNIVNTTTPIVPLTDLGTGTYLGTQGGLYLDGSNVMPSAHDADGLNFAQDVVPRDPSGFPSSTGKIGVLSIGMSIAYDNFQTFTIDAAADPSVSPAVVMVPGAQPRVGAKDWAELTFPAWNAILDYFLPQTGLTSRQVQVAWVEAVDSQPSGSFPADMTSLQSHLESTAQNLHKLFPNLKLAFFNSREYGGYSNGLPGSGTNDPEPYAYESAYAVRGMIQDQINGVSSMSYANAPWVAWGPYTWANGLIARGDGLVWTCQNFEADGTHTSQPGGGTEKVANQMMNFFKTTDVTMPWFLAPPQ
jgi:Putative Ig domain/Abnormal spindle-like microcephaly-assoc'd, ASPM-SPD-2-Hydin